MGGVGTTYSYDGDDTRTSATTGGNTSAYLWDRLGDVDLLIDDGANAYLNEGGVLSEIDASSDTSFDLTDGLGSVRSLTDEQGTLTGTASYDAFGSVTSQSGATSTFGYTGEQTDPSGNLYLRARTYDMDTGRFLSADTVQPNAPGTQGYNRYAYVANNPTTWTDPSGHVVFAAVWILSEFWLPIGIAFGAMFIAMACAVNSQVCTTTLGAVAQAVITIFAIIACVLETGGPCWTLQPQTAERPRTEPQTRPETKPQPQPSPNPVPDQYVPDDPCTRMAKTLSMRGLTAIEKGHVARRHGPSAPTGNNRFTPRAWQGIDRLVKDALAFGAIGPNTGKADCRATLTVTDPDPIGTRGEKTIVVAFTSWGAILPAHPST